MKKRAIFAILALFALAMAPGISMAQETTNGSGTGIDTEPAECEECNRNYDNARAEAELATKRPDDDGTPKTEGTDDNSLKEFNVQ